MQEYALVLIALFSDFTINGFPEIKNTQRFTFRYHSWAGTFERIVWFVRLLILSIKKDRAWWSKSKLSVVQSQSISTRQIFTTTLRMIEDAKAI